MHFRIDKGCWTVKWLVVDINLNCKTRSREGVKKTGLCPEFDAGFIEKQNERQEHSLEVCTRGAPILGRQIHQG